MELSKKDKTELRGKIAALLKNVPDGKRINIDKEMLEYLLFDIIVCKKETGETLKLPVWSGNFLSKIDLSEVSFDNVSWSLSSKVDFIFNKYQSFINKKVWEKIHNCRVNYSNTNAKIDFTKSWESIKTGKFEITRCDFSKVDLSNNDMSKAEFVYCSDLSNTGIVLSRNMIASGRLTFQNVNLSNINLEGIAVYPYTLISLENIEGYTYFNNCNLSNTGIEIIASNKEIAPPESDITISKCVKFKLRDMLTMGYLNGCYINGLLIKSQEEKKKEMLKLQTEYEMMKNDIIINTIESVEKQITKIKSS